MGTLALAAKITHVPSMYLSELDGPRKGTRQDAIDGHVEIGRRCRELGVDTIVVFDRIRENANKMRDKKFSQIVNLSVNETLSRTILTSATVFLVTLAMNIWGTGVIRDFAFAMNVGVIIGTFSSVFIASPILIWLNDKSLQSQKKPRRSSGTTPA